MTIFSALLCGWLIGFFTMGFLAIAITLRKYK